MMFDFLDTRVLKIGCHFMVYLKKEFIDSVFIYTKGITSFNKYHPIILLKCY